MSNENINQEFLRYYDVINKFKKILDIYTIYNRYRFLIVMFANLKSVIIN